MLICEIAKSLLILRFRWLPVNIDKDSSNGINVPVQGRQLKKQPGELWKREAQLESNRVKSRKPKRRSLIQIKIASKLHFADEG